MLPLLEVAVADGWRNRYMAPFYALIISFALVLLLGSLLNKDPQAEPVTQPKTTTEQPDPTPAQPKITFSAQGATTFPGSNLTLIHGDEQTSFEDFSDLPELPTDEKYAVCAVLNDGWTAVGAMRAPYSEYSCWGPFDPKSDKPSELRAKRTR